MGVYEDCMNGLIGRPPSLTHKEYDINYIKEILFQLKCVKEHLRYIEKNSDKSVRFVIEVLDGCISKLGG